MSNVEKEGKRDDIGCGERGGERVGGDGRRTEDNIQSDAEQNSEQLPTTERDGAGLSTGISSISTERGQSTSRDRKLPTWLTKSSKDLALQYTEGFKKRCDRVLRELQRSDGQLVRDIFRFEDPREYEDFIKCIQRDQRYTRGLLQVCREDTHVHVVHDCSFSNGTCRCDWWKKAKTFGCDVRRDRRASRRNTCRSRTAADIQKLLLYYCTKERTTVYQKIGGEVVRLPSEGYNIQKTGLDGVSEIIGEMEVQIPRVGTELQQWQPDLEVDEPDQRPSGPVPRRKKRKLGAQERIQLRVIELLETYPICPPEAIVKHKVWRTDPDLRFKNCSDREIKAAINSYKDQLMSYNIHDFQEIYSREDCQPIFSAGTDSFNKKYYNIENSITILDNLIAFQFDNDGEAIMDFISTVYNIVEKIVPKLNCIVVHSPTGGGKNFFFDCLKDYYINCGHLCHANKYNSFPFQDAEGRRIVHWNEPNYSSEYLEPLKELLGGDTTAVNVKYQHDTTIYRTPIIVTTNNYVTFMSHPTFVDRIKVFNWQQAPFLKQYDKFPNPLAIYHWFHKHGVIKSKEYYKNL